MAADADELVQAAHARRTRPAAHRRDQNHHGPQVDLAAEEAKRWRRAALAARAIRAAEGQPLAEALPEIETDAARLAGEVGRLQSLPAHPAAFGALRGGKLLIEAQQQSVKCRITQ